MSGKVSGGKCPKTADSVVVQQEAEKQARLENIHRDLLASLAGWRSDVRIANGEARNELIVAQNHTNQELRN